MANEDTIIAVQCWSGDVAQVDRALPQYLHHGCPVLILSPTDEPAVIEFPGVECRQAGLDAYVGPSSLDRHRAQMAVLLDHPQRWILLHESDSMCLEPRLPTYLYDERVVWGNPVDTREHIGRNTDPDPDGTYARFPFALQAPWFFHRDALTEMLEVFDQAAEALPEYAKYIDWWFLEASRRVGLVATPFPHGISQPIWAQNEIEAASERVSGGATMVHSVKTKEALASLVAARILR